MVGYLLYLTPLTQPSTLPNKNCTRPNTLTPSPGLITLTSKALTQPLGHTYPHPLAVVFHLTTHTLTPWPMQCYLTSLPLPLPLPLHQPLPLPPLPQTRRAQDKKARSKATRHRRKRRRSLLTPPSHALLSCALPNCIFIATTMAGRPLNGGRLGKVGTMAMLACLLLVGRSLVALSKYC